MTEIERKALALVNEQFTSSGYQVYDLSEATNHDLIWGFCRAIEQHEAFRQEVSDAMRVLEEFITGSDNHKRGSRTDSVRLADGRSVEFSRFIIAKPDPLEEVIADYKRTKGGGEYATNKDMAAALRAALAARGLEIREVGHD